MRHKSCNLSIRIPVELDYELDKLGENKSSFIREALMTGLKNKKDSITILSDKLTQLEREKLEVLETIEKEKRDRENFMERNKEKSESLYIKIYKKLKDNYVVKGGFIENDDLSFEINEYCRLSGSNSVLFRKNIKESILNELEKLKGVESDGK